MEHTREQNIRFKQFEMYTQLNALDETIERVWNMIGDAKSMQDIEKASKLIENAIDNYMEHIKQSTPVEPEKQR